MREGALGGRQSHATNPALDSAMMDLHVIGPLASPAERAAVDAVLGPPESGWVGGPRDSGTDGHAARGGHATRSRRSQLLPALHAVQSRIGWISTPALNYVCKRLAVAPAEAYGVATFYALFATSPRPPVVAHVCDDIACRLAGAEATLRRSDAGRRAGRGAGTGRPRDVAAQSVPRACATGRRRRWSRSRASRAATVALAPVDAAGVVAALEADHAPALDPISRPGRPPTTSRHRSSAGSASWTRTSLDDYRAHGGYAALTRALEIGPEAVIAEVTASKLMGRGGAAFPTGRKWAAVATQPAQPHYLVCNADESEPGTFKDRVLLEGDPFATVEAMTIAAFATGASQGYLYIRGEYPDAEASVAHAIDAARSAGLLGADIVGSGFDFDIELRRGAGAYICGEETALFESIEGKRGEPRNKPPFPVEVGLFGKPTVVNNVETLANIPRIVLDGGEAFARIGTEGSTGPKLFCLSGHVARPGTYEVEFGATLRDLIELAGGVPGDRAIRTILLGGAAGRLRRPGRARHAAHLRGDAGRRRDARLGRDHGLRRDRRPRRHAPADRPVLPRRVVRPVRPVPGRERPPGGAAGAAGGRLARPTARGGARAAARDRPGDARRLDLRARPDGIVGHRIGLPAAGYGGPVTEPFAHGTAATPEVLADILVTPPARASRPPAPPAGRGSRRRSRSRSTARS